MKTVCSPDACNGCMACIDICPQKCISILDNIRSYNAVKDMNYCINCNKCEEICPNINPVELLRTTDWKQGWIQTQDRDNSASGGAAAAMMLSFIRSGGYVAACIFETGRFVFEITNDPGLVSDFAGAKYVKSDPKGIYKKIRERLKTDKVLFIGLPCQVAGLRKFIKNQDNLYTIDLICHGTPSPAILERYLEESGYRIELLKDISFRKKLRFGISSDSIGELEKGEDSYTISFLNGIDYTKNCYFCPYATRNRVADITLGDCWGTELRNEKKKGVSLILVQTDKGREILYGSDMHLEDVNYEKAAARNHQLNHPSLLRSQREVFLKLIESGKTVRQATLRTLPVEVLKKRIKYYL